MEQLLEILFGTPENMNLGLAPLAIAGIGAGISALGGIFGSMSASRQARKQERQARNLQKQITNLEKNRQEVINPYENVTDLSAQINNPFANLQVSTAAAEMRGEQTDIALANTLDTLRATGAGSAGATALAQAAARGKQGVAASIEQQEAQNARLRAQGEQAAMNLRLGEGRRLQQAEAMGKQFVFGAQERRDIASLNRLAGLQDRATMQAGQFRQQAGSALGNALGQIGSIAGSALGNQSFTDSLSDRRLKKDIKFLRLSPSGLKIYSFKYKNQDGIYEGVMSDEIPNYAVVKNFRGIYDGVDYSKIDVQFKRVT
jgi:uncharacterized membrane-anchored protein YhcB (DUF1043 family)